MNIPLKPHAVPPSIKQQVRGELADMYRTHELEDAAHVITALLNQLDTSDTYVPGTLGICSVLYRETREDKLSYDIVELLAQDWEYTTELGVETAFPVPHTPGYLLWDGRNREMRIDLLLHMLRHVTRALSVLPRNIGRTFTGVTKNKRSIPLGRIVQIDKQFENSHKVCWYDETGKHYEWFNLGDPSIEFKEFSYIT